MAVIGVAAVPAVGLAPVQVGLRYRARDIERPVVRDLRDFVRRERRNLLAAGLPPECRPHLAFGVAGVPPAREPQAR